ncbi:MAG TPA: hypothetical protein VKE88_00635 [Candidatus Nanoarchaeia archaeon]|nr:hypothetical protein [Candidatus Nanoarchaeia archaeon]
MKKDMTCTGVCSSCKGWKKVVAGAVLLAAAQWYPAVSLQVVLGWLLVVGGALKVFMPSCGHCK